MEVTREGSAVVIVINGIKQQLSPKIWSGLPNNNKTTALQLMKKRFQNTGDPWWMTVMETLKKGVHSLGPSTVHFLIVTESNTSKKRKREERSKEGEKQKKQKVNQPTKGVFR